MAQRGAPSESPRERAPIARVRTSLDSLRNRLKGPKRSPRVPDALKRLGGSVGRGIRKAPRAGLNLARNVGKVLKRKPR